MNLARGIILLSLLGSVVLLIMGLKHASQLAELRRDLNVEVVKLTQTLAQLARKHSQLSDSLKGENLQGEADFQSYIYKVGTMDRVEIGNPVLSPAQPDPFAKGVVDKRINIRPDNRERTFARTTIANFFYTLEQQSRRVKVTLIRIENGNRRVKPHEIPDDKWTWEAEVTSRQRSD
jgi:hypothetical protein